MIVNNYLVKKYSEVLPYEGVNVIKEKLITNKFLVVKDEEHIFYGILSPIDLIERPHKLVIDCLSKKDSIMVDESIIIALKKFYRSKQFALPVFEGNNFLGVIDVKNMLRWLKQIVRDLNKDKKISDDIKQKFFNILSHEVRTPLNGILGFLDIITKLNLEKDFATASEHYSIVQKSADRFLTSMNDLIELSRIHSGEILKINEEKISIELLFKSLQAYFENNQKSKKVTYINSDISFEFISDGEKINHILHHLIDNGLKHSGQDALIYFGYKISDSLEQIIFFVTNTESQINEKDKKKIFEAFCKDGNGEMNCIAGLGIGLTLVKNFVTILNGNIEVITNIPNETTFQISLPLIRVSTQCLSE